MTLTWKLISLGAAEKVLQSLGLVSRLPINAADVFRFRDKYLNNRNLIAMKRARDGPQDLEDVAALEGLR